MAALAALRPMVEPLHEEFEALFRAHSRLVYRTAYSITGTSQDAEDVVQSLFLHLLNRGFPPGLHANPEAYLYRAAVNLSLNSVKSRRRDCLSSGVSLELVGAGPVLLTNPSDSDADLQERLVDAMRQLKPRTIEMLILRYEHNRSEAEIGKLLGTSRGVVAVTLFRARARLRRLLRASEGAR